MRRAAALLLSALLALAVSGCGTVSYYWQAAVGQFDVGRLARPIDDVLSDTSTSPDLRRRLEYALRARDFASRELGLPDNRSYRRYADLKRPFVVWNVFAAPELSLKLRSECFPVAGCVVYRGYFDPQGAERHAAELRAAGLDVYVGGVPAYSTLGWFADPLLNTFIRYPDLEIARLVFHELAHQVAYVKDDSTFNESFAVAVEEEGLRRWVAGNASVAEKQRFEAFRARRRELVALLQETRRQLRAAYDRGADDVARRAAKRAVFSGMVAGYEHIKAGWGLTPAETRAYDDWVLKDLNNAKLGSIATYTQRVAQFSALLRGAGGDMGDFFSRVKALAALPKAERETRLDALAPVADRSGS